MNFEQKAQELIELGRREVVLDESRLEHNRARVLARVAVLGVVGAGAAASSSAGAAGVAGKAVAGAIIAAKGAAGLPFTKLAVGLMALSGAGTLTHALATRPTEGQVLAPRATQVEAAQRPAESALVSPSPTELNEAESAPPTPSTAKNGLRRSLPNSSADRPRASASAISEHAELLRQARTALAQGDAPRALALLDEHNEVARGPLAPEWTAARVLVLCRLGRVPEAKQLGTRFLKSNGSSPLAAQVVASCAGHRP